MRFIETMRIRTSTPTANNTLAINKKTLLGRASLGYYYVENHNTAYLYETKIKYTTCPIFAFLYREI